MRRRVLVGIFVGLLSACAPTPEQQAAALSPTGTAVETRARQSRRFDTTDQVLMMQSAIGALQDLGYTVEESNASTGVIVGSRLSGGRIRVQVSVHKLPNEAGTAMRATFQRILYRPGAMLPFGDTLDDPAIYQGFFERVAQSAFLTAHEI